MTSNHPPNKEDSVKHRKPIPLTIVHLTQQTAKLKTAVTGFSRWSSQRYAVMLAEGTGVEPVRPATGQWILSPLVLTDDRPLRSGAHKCARDCKGGLGRDSIRIGVVNGEEKKPQGGP